MSALWRRRALGGGMLAGDRVVRLVYLDEAGVANLEHEPFCVASGVIVDADKQLLAVEDYLKELAHEYVPAEKRRGFFFHATELHSGGKTFDRQNWPREKRWPILKLILEIPKKFNLPVVAGAVDRIKQAKEHPERSRADQKLAAQSVAAAMCTFGVERYMRGLNNGEVALMIYEDNKDARKLVRSVHNHLRSEAGLQDAIEENSKYAEILPLRKIVDTAHFAEKTDSSLLQIADACAFAIKRRAMMTDDSAEFFNLLVGQLYVLKQTPGLEGPHDQAVAVSA